MKTKIEIREEIISVNYYILEAMREGDKKSIQKNRVLLNNLIKLYLKSSDGETKKR
jgi:hypothetical protein